MVDDRQTPTPEVPMLHARRLRPLMPHALAELVPDARAESVVSREASARWARSAVEAYGCCGAVAYEDGRVVGHVLICPTLNLPSGHPLTAWSRTPESAALLELWVAPGGRHGTDRHLVQKMAALLDGKVSGIEAAGTTMRPDSQRLDLSWLVSMGFKPTWELRVTAGERVRLDLDSTESSRPGVRAAVGRVRHVVRRPKPGQAREQG